MQVYSDCSTLERQWIEKCRQRDPRAQERLFKHFYGFVAGICQRYAPAHQAQEIINDSFLKVFDSIPHQDDLQNFRGWLRRIVVNTALDHCRREKHHRSNTSLEYVAEEQLADDSVFDQLSVEELLGLLQRLPDHWRMVFNLYEIEGYSHEEIARMLDTSAGSCRVYLARAKQRMRELIQRYDP